MKRRDAREIAFTIVFEMTYHTDTVEEIIQNAADSRDLEVDELARRLAQAVWDHTVELDHLIGQYSTKWKVDRLSRVAASLLRMAMAEALYLEDVPLSVSINEAVELAKKYGGEEDAPFVNGVLGAFARSRAGQAGQPAPEEAGAAPREE